MKKRILITSALLVALIIILAACGGGTRNVQLLSTEGGNRITAGPGGGGGGGGGGGDSFNGAIWTSLSNGSKVNQNLYDKREDVYLNGGPQHDGGSGLPPDEVFYFEVTNPSGDVLLSTDEAVKRQVQTNSDGKIYGYYDSGYGHHPNGTLDPANGSIPVQLFPFDWTPNNGLEYKVHLIRQTPDTWIEDDGIHIHYISSDDKTDNFKVGRPNNPPGDEVHITGMKFYDTDYDGVKDANEQGIFGWQIDLYQNDVMVQATSTDNNGNYSFTVEAGSGVYVVKEVPPSGEDWYPAGLWTTIMPKEITVTVGTVDIIGIDFGNRKAVLLSGHKFYDYDMDGKWDPSEAPLEGWKMELVDQAGVKQTAYTDANGLYYFYVLPNSGTYTITEYPPEGEDWFTTGDWIPTTGKTRTFTVYLSDIAVDDFGNRKIVTLSGHKFYDYDMDGVWDENENEYALEGWQIQLWQYDENLLTDVLLETVTTDANGYYSFRVLPNSGDYTIKEVPPTGEDWYPTGDWVNTTEKYRDVTVGLDDVAVPDFSNRKIVKITGYKWYDTNTDGLWGTDEPAIQGWKVLLFNGATQVDYDYTDATGMYLFRVLPDPNGYELIVTEVAPGGWYSAGHWMYTTAISETVTVMLDDIAGPDFGNVYLGGGGARTIGFWGNKNGEEVLAGYYPAWVNLLDSLNLRNEDGSNYDPIGFTDYEAWLQDANAVNMAYMLSAQLSGMENNVNCHSQAKDIHVDATDLLYAPGINSSNAAGFATVGALMSEANIELGIHGTAYSFDSWRSYQEALKNALDAGNNNLNFVQAPIILIPPY